MNEPDTTFVPPNDPNSPDIVPSEHPKQIGRYRIERVLGKGGFGWVYLAHDDQLNRPVAIKVPRPERISRPEDVEAYLTEARTVANLDHPNIVPVFDVGTTLDGLCFVVSKVIEGIDLRKKCQQARLSFTQAVGLIATVAEALQYAHSRGLVHRDIKPSNILIDTTDKPYLADFGSALKEENIGKGAAFAGTPAYMSPEQARGEGHRVDGRSDIFSLGVVFYELLAGRRPFQAGTQDELLKQFANFEARPPRQIDERIPKELERICLKALAKRASDRYLTARDMAEDLRCFLIQQVTPVSTDFATPVLAVELPSTMKVADSTVVPLKPNSDSQPIKIIPKGLRSFDAHDADFFLELLPGPRDREGLPDSIRFWKTRIEEKDSDNAFSVGLIYGPSGCGKSSLMKAGLLPRLSEDVIAVYVEATAGETETRLLHGLRKHCPALHDNLNLIQTFAALRRGQGIPVGKKVVAILDQFEQWLHTKKEEQDTELVQALRQCDGGRMQCIVMVRDDFWMAATRFMRELEVRLLEGQNSAAVDLFDLDHANKVLAAFGQAFGKLPENRGETSNSQKGFLSQAVSGLAQEGKIISVRLALFAEMMKGKQWTPTTLKTLGGAEGVGITFLDETFSATTAPPEHRFHQKAARGVLKALLPESGTDIKGHMRSYVELLEASGYRSRPNDFRDLVQILDNEIRLITPTDPDGKVDTPESTIKLQPGQKYYQLTHDYLVPSLKGWLTRKQKETRRGRAELLLADRSGVWNARPENRQLPSLWQLLQIRSWTAKKSWTPSQQRMMQRATTYHIVRGLFLGLVLLVITFTGISIRDQAVDQRKSIHASGLVQAVLKADTSQVSAIIDEMVEYRKWTNHLLHEEDRKAEEYSRQKLHISLALLSEDATQIKFLTGRLLDATPHDVPIIRDALFPYRAELLNDLWAVVREPKKGKTAQRLRAAAALAKYDSQNVKWKDMSTVVVKDLVLENSILLSHWIETFRPIKNHLIAPLSDIFRNETTGRETERLIAANLLVDYANDQPKILAELLMDADNRQFDAIISVFLHQADSALSVLTNEIDKVSPPNSTEPDKDKLAKRQANAAISLLKINRPLNAWSVLKHSPDPRSRSYLIHRLSRFGLDPQVIIERFDVESDISIRRALILCLGEFSEDQLPLSLRQRLTKKLLHIYKTDADAGIHGASEWLLRKWDQQSAIKMADVDLRTKEQQILSERLKSLSKADVETLHALIHKVDHINQLIAANELDINNKLVKWEELERTRTILLPLSLSEALMAAYSFDETQGGEAVRAVSSLEDRLDHPIARSNQGKGVDGNSIRNDEGDLFFVGKPLSLECDHPFSIGCWFNGSSQQSTTLLTNRDPKYGYRGLEINLTEARQIWVSLDGENSEIVGDRRNVSESGNILVITAKTKSLDRLGWHHVWVTYNGSKKASGFKIFVDGQIQPSLILSDMLAGTPQTNVPLQIGSRHGTSKFLGEIDEVRVYKACITENDVRLLYESGIQSMVRRASELRTESHQLALVNIFRLTDPSSQALSSELKGSRNALEKFENDHLRQWYINSQGDTMMVVPGPMTFEMGSPPEETAGGRVFAIRHKRSIERTFAIASKFVTVEQYSQFKTDYQLPAKFTRMADLPAIAMNWFDAAKYCNWLSETEGIPEGQHCYQITGDIVAMKADYLNLSGYRMPTEAEMEFATRAGARTTRFFGETEELLPNYAWYLKNSNERTWPVCSLKPNDIGIFGVHGNVMTWCQDRFKAYPQVSDVDKGVSDADDELLIDVSGSRAQRGGSFFESAPFVRSDLRRAAPPGYVYDGLGFRVARTLTVDTGDAAVVIGK